MCMVLIKIILILLAHRILIILGRGVVMIQYVIYCMSYVIAIRI